MLKKFFLVVISVFVLSLPTLGQAITTFMPYHDPQGNIENIIIELPASITEDFTEWPGVMSSYKGDVKGHPTTARIDAVICELKFSKEDTSNTTYILYVYCHKPTVLALQEFKEGSSNNYWVYVYHDNTPLSATEEEFSTFLESMDL